MHVHILGICGTFMGGVAALARAAGHRVTGADRGAYPPMSDQLAALGIDLTEGYEADQLEPAPDVVLVGNVMTRGIPVIEALLNSRIPYTSGPDWLAREVLRDRHVLAVAGTHGKTTTASLLAWILDCAGCAPGFLIGGVPRDFGISARLGHGEAFVIEADEYDTAFFDKRAKFLLYRPRTTIINNLEFDHADIYPDLAAIQRQFHRLIRALPGAGRLIVRAGEPNLDALLTHDVWTPLTSFSSAPEAGADWTGRATGSRFRLQHAGAEVGEVAWQLAGSHNAENATAALIAAAELGVSPAAALAAIGRFGGVKRRLELRGIFGGVELYDDFAHHPTAIVRTLAGIRARGPGGRVLVALEPRSHTMRMGVHREQLGPALAGADHAWVLRPAQLDWNLDAALASHRSISIRDDVARIVSEIAAEARAGDRIVVMSNGGFDGIHDRLVQSLPDPG
jgi:UDP-N-acetylmuramate: L-alanyl-gamma-D-glutamyl-meso-diaminopimelate ligase